MVIFVHYCDHFLFASFPSVYEYISSLECCLKFSTFIIYYYLFGYFSVIEVKMNKRNCHAVMVYEFKLNHHSAEVTLNMPAVSF